MEVFIDPGFDNLGYLLYDSLTHSIKEWTVDCIIDPEDKGLCHKLGAERICYLINRWIKHHLTDLDLANWIYVEYQAPSIFTKNKYNVTSKAAAWMYMLSAAYPCKVQFLQPSTIKRHFGIPLQQWEANKKKAVKFVHDQLIYDDELLNTNPYLMGWSVMVADEPLEKRFTLKHNLSDPFLMMKYVQDTK